ncbi:MAG TPA: zf-HC2 domain-containing protein [Steroidobacteraceae bacterium]|nr:zf-HC2 domain-containing protein [Steroidobacteraceae bacterium]
MSIAERDTTHEETWQMLPWVANGRISSAERERLEAHVRECPVCTMELALQRRLCEALAEPDRVTYAPGPSFRKLLEKIDADGDSHTDTAVAQDESQMPANSALAGSRLAGSRLAGSRPGLWRPPGLAWAASFLLVLTVGVLSTAYRWSEPLYRTHTDASAATPAVLHVAFDRSITLGAIEEMLGANGARVVEGPGNTGIFGVTSAGIVAGQTSAADAKRQIRLLSTRLRGDSRVRWVEPVADDAAPEPAHADKGP